MAKPSDKDSPKKAFISLSRKAVAGWVIVVFIISGWMFGVGVMVGRGTAPIGFDLDQLKRSIDSLKKAGQQEPKGGPKGPTSEMKNKTDLGFYESLPKRRDDADMPNIAELPPAAAKPEPAPPKPVEPPAAAKPEKPAAPPAPPVAAAPAPPAAPPAPGKPLTVQIAAVKSEGEARQLAERLRQKGFAPYVEPISIPDKGVWYRVRMGEFPSKEFARSTMERLQKDGFAPAVVPK
jgi:cell division septation protein DedD